MKLTRASTYALEAVAYMAGHTDGVPMASHAIARQRGISEKFLLKVLTPLVRSRILFSLKGPNGGYRLARPANKISVLDVVEAVDGPIRGHAPVELPSEGKCDLRLEEMCNQAAEQLRRHLEKHKISDLTEKKK